MDINIKDVIGYMNSKNYKVFTGGKLNYNLNIVNIRNDEFKAGSFDDLQLIFWYDLENNLNTKMYLVTTDSGLHYLKNPMNTKGTAIVKEGQYNGMWRLGKHFGYDALVQNSPIWVIRDFNRDMYLDYEIYDIGKNCIGEFKKKIISNNEIIYECDGHKILHLERGMFGINCHHAGKKPDIKNIGLNSAGCCVHYSYERYWSDFIPLIKKAVLNYGNSFTVTYINYINLKKYLS